MSGFARKALPLLAVGAVGVLAGCQGPFPQSTFQPVTDFAEAIDGLYRLIFWWAVVVFVVVEVGIVYVLFRFRTRPDRPDPAPIHGHTALEIAWTLAPALIIVFIAVPTIQVIWQDARPVPDDALEVQVVGHQWWWEFRYPEYGIVTANEMHIPQGRTVVLNMTSADVIHSFWIPRLGGKRDVILGRTTRLLFTADSTGTFLGQCAEFCGASHANMRMRVMVDAPAEFAQWVALEQSTPAVPDSLSPLAQQGRQVFSTIRTDMPTHSCVICHAVAGVSGGVAGPNLSHIASRTTIAGGILPNTADALARWLRDPSAIKPGTGAQAEGGPIIGMPTVNLTEDEISALVAYLLSLR